MTARQKSSTSNPVPFFMADSTDHISGKTGLTPTVTLSKDGGSFASASGTVSEIGNGWYKLAGNATDRGTIGELILHASATGADTAERVIDIVAHDPFAAAWEQLTASAGQIIHGTVDTVTNSHTPTTTEFQADDITEATSEHYKGRNVIFTSGALVGQMSDITAYVAVGGIGQFTVTALTEAPANNDTFLIV